MTVRIINYQVKKTPEITDYPLPEGARLLSVFLFSGKSTTTLITDDGKSLISSTQGSHLPGESWKVPSNAKLHTEDCTTNTTMGVAYDDRDCVVKQ